MLSIVVSKTHLLAYKSTVNNIVEPGRFSNVTVTLNGNTCIGIWCKEGDYIEPFANLTVNLDLPLIKNTAFIDVNNLDKRLISYLEKNGFIKCLKVTRRSGYVTYPLYRLELNKIKEYKF